MAGIECFPASVWASHAAMRIQAELIRSITARGHCSVMLTGGDSARRLYQVWSELPARGAWANTAFYFGDERCVPPQSPESNYRLAMQTLFRDQVPPGCRVERMRAESADLEAAAAAYAGVLPEKIDVLLLGVGEDGHIASLFPGSEALRCRKSRVVPVVSPKPPTRRLTVTPLVVEGARTIFVLAPGPGKRAILDRITANTEDPAELPAVLVRSAIWLTDTPGSKNYPLQPEAEGRPTG